MKRIPTHKKCKCKKFCSQTRLVGEIYSSDVIMHRGYCKYGYDAISYCLPCRKKIQVEDNGLWWFLFFTSRTFSISCKNSLKRHYRQNNNLTLPRYRRANGQRTFAYCGAKMHNTSSKDMRHGKSGHFKHNFKKYF